VPAGISYLYYADRVYQLPLALIGTALGTVLLASLAKLIAKKQWAAAHRMQNQALIFSLLFALPAAAGIYALSEEIIKVLFGRGQFDEIAVFQTAQALKVFALALPAFVLMKVLSNSFFAAGDTKTPVKIAALSLLVNMAISWVLLPELKHVAIALGAALSAWLAIFVQALILLKRKQISIYSATYLSAGKITFATAIMFAALKMIADFHLSFYATLTIQISAGALIYFVCLALLGEMKQMKKMLSKEASKLQ
jgi:putative peptidoglycan lipid II flippase